MAKKIARHAVMQQRRLQRLIDSEDMIDRPDGPAWEMKLDFVNTPPSGQDVLIAEDLGKAFGDHVLFEHANLILRRGERIALVGPNGAGKTTLLRMVTGEETPTSGSVRLGAGVKLGYFAQEQESLDWNLTPLETVRRAASLSETDARTFLHFFLFAGDDVFVPVGNLSYGERARLALGVLVLQGCNLLLLDEPVNHLDIPSRERFEEALENFEGSILAVVHDRYFVERFATAVWPWATAPCDATWTCTTCTAPRPPGTWEHPPWTERLNRVPIRGGAAGHAQTAPPRSLLALVRSIEEPSPP
jgi:ATP-binding cassette subfamily F protein 3